MPNAVNGGTPFFEYRNQLRKFCLKVANHHSILPAALNLNDVKSVDSIQRAAGGFADVFCGTYRGNKVALKRLRAYMMSTDTQKEKLRMVSASGVIHTVRRHLTCPQAFYRESILWKGLIHVNIVPFLGVTEDLFGGVISMVLPWFDNGSARVHLDRMKQKGVSDDDLLVAVDTWVRQRFIF